MLRDYNLRHFFQLGRASFHSSEPVQHSLCLTHNKDRFRDQLITIGGMERSDIPPEDTTPEATFYEVLNMIQVRLVQIRQLYHIHRHQMVSPVKKCCVYVLIVSLLLAEALMIRPALRDIFLNMGFLESAGYMAALIIGLAVLLHITGAALRSKSFWVAAASFTLIAITNGLLIKVRAMTIGDSSQIILGLFSCVATIITGTSIWLTYRISADESQTEPPAIDFDALAHEHREERRRLRAIFRARRHYKRYQRAFYAGRFAEAIKQLTLPRHALALLMTIAGILTGGHAISAADFGLRISSRPSSITLGQGSVGLDLAVDAKDPSRLVKSLQNCMVTVFGENLSERQRIPSDAIPTWSWTPTRTGDFQIRLSAVTRGGYPVTAHTAFTVSAPKHGFAPPIDIAFEPAKEFDVFVPVPTIPYPKVDLTFVTDVSQSMEDEIDAIKLSSNQIFASLFDYSTDPEVSVVTFSHVATNTAGALEPLNYRLSLPSTSDRSALANFSHHLEGGNESTFFALHHAAFINKFRSDALRFLVLSTDEYDNIYEDNHETKLGWHNHGNLSPNSILSSLRQKGFCVALIYSALSSTDVERFYTKSMKEIMGPNFGGAHPLSTSSSETANRVALSIQQALQTLEGQTRVELEISDTAKQSSIETIRPSEPANCIDGQGFSLGRLRASNASGMTFKVTLRQEAPPNTQRFFLVGRTDKGTTHYSVPIILRN